MSKTITPSALQKRISRELRDAGSGRKLAARYKINQRYISDALHGLEIHNQEARYALGLDVRPKPAWLDPAVCLLRKAERGERIQGAVFSRKGKVVKVEE
jgi:hypothetical protein